MKQLDGGPNRSAPYISTRSPHYLWYKETRRPSLIRFGKVDLDFMNQEQSAPKSLPRSHMDSVLDILYMDGKIRG
jgi:hypothetical protein